MAAILIALMLVAAASAASVDRCPPHLPRDRYLKAHENFCYRFHLHDVREYDNARSTCIREGGTLAMPKTNEIDSFIARSLHYTYGYRYKVWIGLNDKQQESVFRWEDGSILHPSDYSDWGVNEGPDHVFGGGWENCVAIDPAGGRYKWTDIQCSGFILLPESYAFVCQFDAVQPPSLEQCPSDLPRDGYLKAYENFCYRFHLYDQKEYNNARTTCLNEGGILAMPKTNETDYFIALELHYTFKYHYKVWIGLHDKEQESVFKWEDGSILHPSDYSDWGFNEGPNHIFGGWENCVAINPQEHYSWNDVQCSDLMDPETHAFVCQFDAMTGTGTSEIPSVTTTNTPETTTQTVTTPKPTTPQPTTTKPTTPQPTTTTTPQPTTTTTPQPTTPEPTTTTPEPTTTTPEPTTTTPEPTTTTPEPTTTTPEPTTTTPEPTTTTPEPTTTTPEPTTTTPESTTTTPEPTTTKPTTPQPNTPTTPITEGCPPFTCGLDCGMDGYGIDKDTGCPICKCNV